ncbi:hypothetical protein [Comamonas thiooxydans]|uniref:hypothetical protein n=1 Tax=Comamonas thiooxydans TaxID=363952 RepID=UPI00050DF03A|nr:hypothetical protein [Comamonas thiooxydans]KGG82465.1 hypothetical protein P609_19820 [Comamonas thiooxydans]
MPNALTDTQIQMSGVLLQDAEVRTGPMGDDNTAMPVLCLVMQTDGSCTAPVRAEQVYPAGLRSDADRAAKSMKKGMRVTVWAPIAQLRTTLGMSSRIQVHGRATQAKANQSKEATHA